MYDEERTLEICVEEGTLEFHQDTTLVLPVWQKENPTVSERWMQQLPAHVQRALADVLASGVTGELGEVMLIPTFLAEGNQPSRLLLLGLGKPTDWDASACRRAAASLAKASQRYRVKEIHLPFLYPDAQLSDTRVIGVALAEGILLSRYNPSKYKTDKDNTAESGFFERITVWTEQQASVIRAAIDEGTVRAEATNVARRLANEPGNMLTPYILAERATAIAEKSGLDCEILSAPELERLGMGGILAVGSGSDNPPCMIVLRYRAGKGSGSEPPLALVGKGITFDTGGISIKPSDGMEEMKMDMAGAAAVLGAMQGIARLGADRDIIGIICAAENMPGGKALKPGDVIHTFAGKTIEVTNTDAEGRLVLADGVAYARSLSAKTIIDIATLTGAAVIALGSQAAAVMGTSEKVIERLREAGARVGERFWPMPMYPEYKEQYKSHIADIKNVGGREAGCITAGMIIGEFVGETDWVHIDIAGVAWTKKASDLQPVGATGFGVRSLIEFVRGGT